MLGTRLLSLLHAALALLLLGLTAACGTTTSASAGPASAEATRRTPAAVTPERGAAVGESPSRGTRVAEKPARAPDAAAEPDRERLAEADWAPGQLEAHFEKHGSEGPYRTAAQYDAAARETIRRGTHFSYVDRESNAERVGFYDGSNNRFTSLTRDGRRITTHFRPDRGAAYVRGLTRSTYR